MASSAGVVEFADLLPTARFRELHTRVVARPVDDVWAHCLDVTAKEVRTLGPLLGLRGIPARLTGKPAPVANARKPLLDVFVGEGFIALRRDEAVVDGRAVAILGAAGKFWSLRENAPISFDDAQAFIDFSPPGFAKTVARIEAIALPNGTTRIETETVIVGTDRASTRKFAPYWAVIRLPSGLIRRSWLAAIDRRATA